MLEPETKYIRPSGFGFTGIANQVTELIGKTPMVWLTDLLKEEGARVAGKLEAFNPGGSVKDRIALSMIEAAEATGDLQAGMTIIEPTSGNTGIALAWVAACKGYRLILTMPETMTRERRDLLMALGAELILTPATQGMAGAVAKARELAGKLGSTFIPSQFDNPANPSAHYRTTGPELWEGTNGEIDVLIAGIGTGGTITGAGQYLKTRKPSIQILGVEPAESPLITGGKSGPHRVEGIGANFLPHVFDRNAVDDVLTVPQEEAFQVTRRLAREKGILAGISSGAAVAAALRVATSQEHRQALIVAILPDTGERYLSTWVFKA